MTGDGGEISMGYKCSTPNIWEIVDDALGEVRLDVQDVGKFEPRSRCEWGPVIVWLWWRWHRRRSQWEKTATVITG